MPIIFKKQVAILEGHCAIEEAESLQQWLIATPKGKINAKTVTHIHTAVLQVIMAAKPTISVSPQSQNISNMLRAAALQ